MTVVPRSLAIIGHSAKYWNIEEACDLLYITKVHFWQALWLAAIIKIHCIWLTFVWICILNRQLSLHRVIRWLISTAAAVAAFLRLYMARLVRVHGASRRLDTRWPVSLTRTVAASAACPVLIITGRVMGLVHPHLVCISPLLLSAGSGWLSAFSCPIAVAVTALNSRWRLAAAGRRVGGR